MTLLGGPLGGLLQPPDGQLSFSKWLTIEDRTAILEL